MTRVLVIRHGHADGNAEHRFIGQTDVSLDDTGRIQAQALAERLRNSKIDRIVSSDLRRAIDTISPLAEALEIPIQLEPRLREISNGEWSGLLPAEISAGWPDLWNDYRSGTDVLRPGGEQWRAVRERAIEAVNEHAGSGDVIVFCTHGGPALNLALWAAGLPTEGNIFLSKLGALDNTSITTIDLDPDSGDVRLIGFNDTGHLLRTPDVRIPFDPVP